MTRYHVYLPPPTLSKLDDTPIPCLTFQPLGGSTNHPSQHDLPDPATYTNPSKSAGSTLASRRKFRDDDLDVDENADQRSRSRAVSVKRSRGPLRKTQTELAPEGSRRRSNRLGRGLSDGLIGTLPGPGLDTTESFMSLNTTASNISQPFPPTAEQSSLLNLPRWSIPLTKLTTLPALLSRPHQPRGRARDADEAISLLVCVLSVEQPVQRQRKEEKARGQEGTLWIGNWVVTAPTPAAEADSAGSCPVKLWDNVAREWGDERIRKGDVVLLENARYNRSTAKDPSHIVLSDQARPKITVLYRTMPRYHSAHDDYVHATRDAPGATMRREDRALRPDLRLSRSDMGVRKVAEMARWFAQLIGGDAPA